MRYVKILFINIQKKQNMLNISLLIKKITIFTGKFFQEFQGLGMRKFQGIFFI